MIVIVSTLFWVERGGSLKLSYRRFDGFMDSRGGL